MSAAKIVTLLLYAVLAGLALTQGDSSLGVWSLRILVVLAVAHSIEVLVFFKVCKEAPGPLPGHLLNVFLFGIFHVKDLKQAQRA